jgi:hypothetical protein
MARKFSSLVPWFFAMAVRSVAGGMLLALPILSLFAVSGPSPVF